MTPIKVFFLFMASEHFPLVNHFDWFLSSFTFPLTTRNCSGSADAPDLPLPKLRSNSQMVTYLFAYDSITNEILLTDKCSPEMQQSMYRLW